MGCRFTRCFRLGADLAFLEVDTFEEEHVTRPDDYVLTTSSLERILKRFGAGL